MAITRNDETGAIEYTDLGVTMRTLMAVAADGFNKIGRREWRLRYRGVTIGRVQVKDTTSKGMNHANSNAGRTGKSTGANPAGSESSSSNGEASGTQGRTNIP